MNGHIETTHQFHSHQIAGPKNLFDDVPRVVGAFCVNCHGNVVPMHFTVECLRNRPPIYFGWSFCYFPACASTAIVTSGKTLWQSSFILDLMHA